MSAHVIYRQLLHLQLPAATEPSLLSQVEHALLTPAVQDALATAFSQALAAAGLPPDSWLTFDHLHLDLGSVLLEELPNHLLAQLTSRLSQQAVVAQQPAGASPLPGGGAAAGATVSPAPAGTSNSAAHTILSALLYFLTHGTLPAYWPAPVSGTAWERALREALRASPALLPALRLRLRQPLVGLRLLRQFSPAFVTFIFRMLVTTRSDAPPAGLSRQFATLLRSSAAGAGLGFSAEKHTSTGIAASEALALALLAHAADPAPAVAWEHLLSQLSSFQRPTPSGVAKDAGAIAPPPAVLPADSYPPPASGSLPAPKPVEYVANAGLVLLHPFLPACFAACGWLDEEQQFINPAAQARAVLLLHFLATGRGQAPEYELRLPQLLCGVAPTAPPPPRRLTLGWPARAEGRALLRAALAHWTALRRTSPAALRTAFLQREGKLELTERPLLTVATQAQDVLLSHLPYGWSVSLVQLPWLAAPLHVEWT